MIKQNNKGFTLIELLVVVAIIGLLSTLAVVALNSARLKSRDAKRVADIKQVQTALELYFADQNNYPTSATAVELGDGGHKALCSSGSWAGSCSGGTTYMGLVPATALPSDGPCTTANNAYMYASAAGTTYTINFCLGGAVGDLAAGPHTASPNGIQ